MYNQCITQVFCKSHHSPFVHDCDKVPEKERVEGVEYKSSQPCHICKHSGK